MTMRLTAFAVAAFISVTALAVAAAPDRASYIDELDPICKQTDRKMRQALKGFEEALGQQNHDHDRAARLLGRAVKIYAKSIKRIGEVEPPTDDADRIAKWLRLEGKDVAVTRDMVKALRRDKVKKYNNLVDRSIALEKRIDRTIGDYGFRHCN